MSFHIYTNINNQAVTVVFNWTGKDEDGGPDWDTMEVRALLPIAPDKVRLWVIVNDLLSDDDWVEIEMEIYAQWKELERQASDEGA